MPERGEPALDAVAGFCAETDADLMAYMVMAREDPAGARAAWGEFYTRHASYLYNVCMSAYASMLGGEAGVCDLVADTFKRAYDNARTFDADGIEEPDRLRRRTRAWLGRIAQRLFQDALRERARLRTVHLNPEMWEQIASEPEREPADPRQIARVQDALAQLSEKEQTVVRVTFQWHQPGREHQRLPNDVAAELAAALQTTPENLRQIRRRAMKKIRAYLETTRETP